ncbi:MAG: Fe-Mn family superoxide dismutase [Candidatus Harrisonbacteria bacterium]|nr:Fe-Mn family superoxide dismutase [Candidatus Harrisonbacteria bacterium]
MKNRKDFDPISFDFPEGLEDISEKLLDDHKVLYEGYVNKTNEIQSKVDATDLDKAEPNQSYSEFGELKRQETFSVNGMKLHEVYFNHLKKGGSPLEGPLKEMIGKDFGSVDAWKKEMIATGIASRGWAILAYDFKDDRLHIYGQDAHNVGAVWSAAPIIALDVYEHAYFTDYGKDRKQYIDAFFKNLDFAAANKIVAEWKLDQMHKG